MGTPAIPYQKSDFVFQDEKSIRPSLPPMVYSHSLKDRKFVITEDTPLNRRNFIYQPCCPNQNLLNLKYVASEYSFEAAGINIMDRSDSLALLEGTNDVLSVPMNYGWRSARSDSCIKEGMAYWEIEILEGGVGMDNSRIVGDKKHFQQRLTLLPHLRFGISRRESSLETPIGCDAYGYGIRDINLESIHNGKLTQVLKAKQLKPGDQIGLLLKLPSFAEQCQQAKKYAQDEINSLNIAVSKSEGSKKRAKSINVEFQKALLRNCNPADIIRDQIAIRYKNQLFFESTDYVKKVKQEYINIDAKEPKVGYFLKDSFFKVFLNGEELGDAFAGLQPFLPPFSELNYNEQFYMNHWKNYMELDKSDDNQKNRLLKNKFTNNGRLGYYPTISCFNGGVARIITLRSKMKYLNSILEYEKENSILTLDEIYKHQIADDIVWDIIDEIEAEEMQGTLEQIKHGMKLDDLLIK